MKRTKILYTIMILILCISTICSGVYSATILSAQISGTLRIIPAQALNNAVTVRNAENLDISIVCSVENGTAENIPTTAISSGVWEAGNLVFSDETVDGQLRLQTLKMKMLVTNNDRVPISVQISGTSLRSDANISVITIGNSYIASNDTEEISIQFSAEYPRGAGGSIDIETAPSISSYSYTVAIKEVDFADTLLSRVKFNESGAVNGLMNFYVEFGTNSYYTEGSTTHSEKLKWYIWAKDDGEGNPVALESGTDYDGSTFLGGGIYYFISEYVLDVQDSSTGLSYQNEYKQVSTYYCTNLYGYAGCDYAGSNYRNYLNGLTVKQNSYCVSSSIAKGTYFSDGNNINFLDRFNLTDDVIYSQILDRDLEEMYTECIWGLPADYVGQADKFWALSQLELYQCIGDGDGAVGYTLSSPETTCDWWLRTPLNNTMQYCVESSGGWDSHSSPYSDTIGVRPAFKLSI